MFIIKDGTGTGYAAKVNKDGQLNTFTVTMTYLQYASIYKEDAYSFLLSFKQQSGGTEECAGIFTYTGTRRFIISKIGLNTRDSSLTIFKLMLSPIRVSGGTLVTMGNLNLFSSKQLSSTIYSQNDTTPITLAYSGVQADEITIKSEGRNMYEPGDDLVLKPNFPVGILVTCTNTNSLVRISLSGYEID